MSEAEFDRGKVIRYLVWTFALAYLIQLIAGWVWNNISILAGQLITAAMMFVPMLSVLLSGGKLSGMGWNPKIRKNWKQILIAWLAPAALSTIGAALYFLIFPDHFDLSGSYVAKLAGEEALGQLEEQGMTYPLAILVTAAAALTYAPFLNMLPGLGEEAGWRGFLYPQLRARFGHRKAWLLGGAIWGA